MVRPSAQLGSLRFSRLEKERLLLALLFSLLVHLGVWGGYEVGKKTGLWEKWHMLRQHPMIAEARQPVDTAQPTVFVDVTEASPEPPKQAKYYSDKNSRAANPDADLDSNVPKLAGTQKEVPKTEDTPRPVKAPAQQPQPPQQPNESKPAQNDLAHALMPGDLAKANPAESPNSEPKPETTPQRPRTLQQARAMQPNQIAGMKMQQQGGVKRRDIKSSLDTIATPFGAYDRAIIEAIQQRWYDLLDHQKFALDRTGKVTIRFHLNPDGSVTEARIIPGNQAEDVGEVLSYICQEAIEQAAPFGKWPPDMRRMVGANFREITFTFYYY